MSETLPPWSEPRRVEEFWWMDLEEYWIDPEGETSDFVIKRYGRVSWHADGKGYYSVSMHYEYHHGLGLFWQRQYRVLSEAQDFIEELWPLSIEQVQRLHAQLWRRESFCP